MLFKVEELKTPSHLDFCTFFKLVDTITRNILLKQQPTAPAKLYLYSSKNEATTSFSLTICDEGRILDAIYDLIEENSHDYYAITAESWCASAEDTPEYQYGDINKLPIWKKKEQLIVNGQTNDGKLTRTILYDIIRARAGDESSRVLRFEKFADSDDCSTLFTEGLLKTGF
jgi:hypothetical protein